jgi:hypothetical protein
MLEEALVVHLSKVRSGRRDSNSTFPVWISFFNGLIPSDKESPCCDNSQGASLEVETVGFYIASTAGQGYCMAAWVECRALNNSSTPLPPESSAHATLFEIRPAHKRVEITNNMQMKRIRTGK